MEAQVFTINRKAELRDKIRTLEAERSHLESEINVLREKVEVKDLEAYTHSLENEVGSLRIEKTILEERASITTPYNIFTNNANGEEGASPLLSALDKAKLIEETLDEGAEETDGIVQPISGA